MINIKEQLSESDIYRKMSEEQQNNIIDIIKESCEQMGVELKTVKIKNPFLSPVCVPNIIVVINNDIHLSTGVMIEDI